MGKSRGPGCPPFSLSSAPTDHISLTQCEPFCRCTACRLAPARARGVSVHVCVCIFFSRDVRPLQLLAEEAAEGWRVVGGKRERERKTDRQEEAWGLCGVSDTRRFAEP